MERSISILGWSAAALSTGVAGWALYKWCSLRRYVDNLTCNKYTTEEEVRKQLVHHFVDIDNLMHLKDLISPTADNYHERLAKLCADACDKFGSGKLRVLDVGCGVGGASFHLTKHFAEVIGADTSHEMLAAGQHLKQFSEYVSPLTSEGGKHIKLYKIKVSDDCQRDKVEFLEMDVCSRFNVVGFDCVLVSNVLTDLKYPKTFLQNLTEGVPPKGILVIADPFLWPGGPEEKLDGDGSVKTIALLGRILGDSWSNRQTTSMPLYVPQSERVAQVASAEVSVWQRLPDADSSD
ncbi:Methyltransferase type 11, partial [Trinorchestia longiramus]